MIALWVIIALLLAALIFTSASMGDCITADRLETEG